MNENAAEVLKHIADKLDIPVQQLWAGLVAYAPFTYYQWLTALVLSCVVFAGLSGLAAWLFYKARKMNDFEPFGAIGGVVSVLAGLVFIFGIAIHGVGESAEALAAKHAPEAWASKHIIKKIGR